jgi:exosortase E/protease (VPEID-CTERM system)
MQIDPRITIRIVALGFLLLLQIIAASLEYSSYIPGLQDSEVWFSFIAHSGQISSVIIVIILFSLLGVFPRLPEHFSVLSRSIAGYRYYNNLFLQLTSYTSFLWLTSLLFDQQLAVDQISEFVVVAWLISIVATGYFWLLSVAPLRYWRGLMVDESKTFMMALLGGAGYLIWVIAQYSQTLWLPLTDLTYHLSASMLDLIYPEIISNYDTKILGVQKFIVNVAPQCSGYEGIGLVTIFTAIYLSAYRKEFRFPQALLLFPIGIVTIWLFNIFRIVILISIGTSFSPAVAMGGFHSQAGWISFSVVSIAIIIIACRVSFFSTITKSSDKVAAPITQPMALLIPFIVLMASTILTSALVVDFVWLYPLRVIAVAIALACCWRIYQFSTFKFNLEPCFAGLAVFLLWIVLVPNDVDKNNLFAGQLFAESGWVVSLWLLFRFLGAVLTVPIAEELLFRGYLLSRLSRVEVSIEGRMAFSWIALSVSSILFGLLHADWLAGTLAGLVYGLVRYRSNSIKDAVIAHSTTNLLLSIYVFSSASWSLW